MHKCVLVIPLHLVQNWRACTECPKKKKKKKKKVTTNQHIEETGKCLDVSIDYDSDCSIFPTPLNL